MQQTTEATGQRIATALTKGRTFGGKQPWPWFHDAIGRTVGYIGSDATGVRQQGPRGERADGRMAYAVRSEVLGYFRNQVHRMDYPAYESNGWYTGSGAVESACETVVGQWMKGAGRRWSEAGAHAVCHVRALYRSEQSQWDAFWQRSLAA